MLAETVFGQDGNFSYGALVERDNSDLANGLGNLVSRTVTMIETYCAGAFPKGSADLSVSLAPWRVPERIQQVRSLYEQYQFTRALEEIWRLITDVDMLISEQKPWVLAEDPAKRAQLETVLWIAADTLRVVAVLAHPVIPNATERLWKALGQGGSVGGQGIDALEFGTLRPGTRIAKAEALFRRADKQEAMA